MFNPKHKNITTRTEIKTNTIMYHKDICSFPFEPDTHCIITYFPRNSVQHVGGEGHHLESPRGRRRGEKPRGRRGGERRNHLEDAGVEEAAGGDPEEGARDVVGVLGRLLDLSSRRRHGW